MNKQTRWKQQTILPACGFALGFAFCAPAGAQEAVTQPTALTASTPYLLAADDEISVKVVNFSDLSVPATMVTPDGSITVPLLGAVGVTGQTTAQVAQTLTSQWAKYVINPSVSVSLVQKRKQDVLFYGSVSKAGTEDYRPAMHLLSALAETGGSLPTGDLSTVTVTHTDGRSQTLDLSHPEAKGGTPADILLLPGDVVYIPERRDQFSVLGEVSTPGSFEYKDDMTVLDALTRVGGVKDTADLSGATLVHNGKESPLNLDALLRKGDLSVNAKLASGDRILVPETHDRVYVFGSVGHPGYYAFKAGDRVLDALNSSEPEKTGDLAKINLIHVDKTKNVSKTEQVNIQKFLSVGDMTGNVLLQPNDVLFIPDKHKSVGIGDLLPVLSGLSIIRVLGGH